MLKAVRIKVVGAPGTTDHLTTYVLGDASGVAGEVGAAIANLLALGGLPITFELREVFLTDDAR